MAMKSASCEMLCAKTAHESSAPFYFVPTTMPPTALLETLLPSILTAKCRGSPGYP